jgi:hypothetical protein
MKQGVIVLMFLMLASCKTATERWLSGLADNKELQAGNFSLEMMKVKPASADTTSLNYKIRIYPSKQWAESKTSEQKAGMYYGMDSCFSLQAGKKNLKPSLFQPVNNGIANCYEYLISFEVSEIIKSTHVELLYHDKLIDGKQHIIELNK